MPADDDLEALLRGVRAAASVERTDRGLTWATPRDCRRVSAAALPRV